MGLPLAVKFSKKRVLIGFDINKDRSYLFKKKYINPTLEITIKKFNETPNSNFISNVDVYDLWFNKKQVAKEYKIRPTDKPIKRKYNTISIGVSHNIFKSLIES